MKKIRRTTAKERLANQTYSEVKVADTGYFFWACDSCDIAFFDDDIILKNTNKSSGHACPLTKKGFVTEKICRESILGGNKEDFEKYYRCI